MQLIFKNKYLSIDNFDSVELPDFTILTGMNGSGKTHLLTAIKDKSVIVSGMENEEIVYFNYETFRLGNENQWSIEKIGESKKMAWEAFKNLRSRVPKDDSVGDFNSRFLHFLNDSNNKRQFPQLVMHIKPIYSFIQKKDISIEHMEEGEFFTEYTPYDFDSSQFLPKEIGKIILDYYIRFLGNQVNLYLNKEYDKDYYAILEEDFLRKNGEKPWDIINKILERFGALSYRVMSPEGLNLSNLSNFKLKLKDSLRDIEIDFGDLSSGEKILMALVAVIYKAASDNQFPEVLLLDEIDASLHPSMIKNLLDVIEDIFLKRGMKVILVTHSPTTVALSPENSIFIMNKEGPIRIEKANKEEAVTLLSEGFITLESGVKLFDQISKSRISLISEGNNISYLKKAIELYNLEGVDVIKGAEKNSGKNILKTIFNFFKLVEHKNTIIFVWDCDVEGKIKSLSEDNNTFRFVFEKNEDNDIAKGGIENLFSKDLCKPFEAEVTKTTRKGTKPLRLEFDCESKKEFEQHIINRSCKEDFKNFEPLIDKIKSFLNK